MDLSNLSHFDLLPLFTEFNQTYFWNSLTGIEVKWSNRMTLCAGLCYYKPREGFVSIRLSEPLLRYRSIQEMVETLLHEMIHAYLFLTERIQDHDGHGNQFCSHMHRINTATGLNITIYHNFKDEVDYYRNHVWQCNGICKTRPPFFGIVKRSMNRPPQQSDRWWNDHQITCGGIFFKISEPEKKEKKEKSKRKGKNALPRIDGYFKKKEIKKEEKRSICVGVLRLIGEPEVVLISDSEDATQETVLFD